MAMSFSPHVAIEVADHREAARFYQHAFGMRLVAEDEAGSELQLGPMTFHVASAPTGRTCFEFRTDDLELERERLVLAGCKVTRIHSPKQILMEDPFGLRFHLYED
ncbi:MAG: VOC family protein [Candidatus Sericytochromatia bacterium]